MLCPPPHVFLQVPRRGLGRPLAVEESTPPAGMALEVGGFGFIYRLISSRWAFHSLESSFSDLFPPGRRCGEGSPCIGFQDFTLSLSEPNFLSSCSHDVIVSRVGDSSGVSCSGNHDCIIASPVEGLVSCHGSESRGWGTAKPENVLTGILRTV